MSGDDMIIESQLREQMARAVDPSSSLSPLYEWLMARSRNMHRDSSRAAVELAAEVEAALFDRADGRLSDAEARARILELLNTVRLTSPIDVSEAIASARPRLASSRLWVQPRLRPVAA